MALRWSETGQQGEEVFVDFHDHGNHNRAPSIKVLVQFEGLSVVFWHTTGNITHIISHGMTLV